MQSRLPNFDTLRPAQAEWAATPLPRRLEVLRRFRHLLAARALEAASKVWVQRGQPTRETLTAEIVPLADACRFLEREAPRILKTRRLGWFGRPLWLQGVRAEVQREPLGVVLIVGPANYPFFLPGVQLLQALAAGNAVLLKAGEGGGAGAWFLAELLADAGLDRRLLAVLSESPLAAHEALAAGVDKVFLTGSARTGAAVLATLAPRLVPAVVELSGCDALFVRADADLDLVARALRFGLRLRQGETCIAPRRIFVARERAAELEERIRKTIEDLRDVVSHSPSAKQAVLLVREALARGSRLVAGKLPALGEGLRPLVLGEVSPDLALLHEDLFAPVAALLPVKDDEDALRQAARCPYALGAAVFGEETGARALAQRVRAGVVVINDLIVPTVDPRLPFGGRGRSGFGTTRGVEGLLEMTAPRVVAVRSGRFRPHLDPPREEDTELATAYLQAVHGGSLGQRVAGWWALLTTLVRSARRGKKEQCP